MAAAYHGDSDAIHWHAGTDPGERGATTAGGPAVVSFFGLPLERTSMLSPATRARARSDRHPSAPRRGR